MKLRASTPAKSGFTLVEVAIAIGIVSFALLSCVGLNAVSLSSFTDARTVDVSTRIFRTVLNEAQISDFSSLNTNDRWFDSEGFALETPARSLYTVRLELGVSNVAGVPLDSANARTLKVKVFANGTAQTQVATRTVLIGNRLKGN